MNSLIEQTQPHPIDASLMSRACGGTSRVSHDPRSRTTAVRKERDWSGRITVQITSSAGKAGQRIYYGGTIGVPIIPPRYP